MRSLKIENRFSNEKGSIIVKLPVLLFKEDNSYIIYCPALDLAATGNSQPEAKGSFEIVINEYLNYTTNKGSLIADLKKLGWIIHKKGNKVATPPLMSDLLESNQEFNRIFNNYSYKKFDQAISLPAFA